MQHGMAGLPIAGTKEWYRYTQQIHVLPAGGPLFAVGRVVSAGPAGASTPLTFSAHYDNHWDFTTHELVFVIKSLGAEAAAL